MFRVQCLPVLCFLVFVTYATSQKDIIKNESEAEILFNEYTIDEHGNYRFSYGTSNGITRTETGAVISKGEPNQYVLKVSGLYAYINTNGEKVLVEYISDDKGYRVLPPRIQLDGFKSSHLIATLLGR